MKKKPNILKLKDFKLRNLEKMKSFNNGTRSLNESILAPEVISALEEWKRNNKSNGVLIEGLAYSYYCKPRETQDVDILYLSKEDIPDNVNGFKRTRNSAFQHNLTHVEIEVITPEHINISSELAKLVYDNANLVNGIKIASPAGIVALKLQRQKRQDMADIEELVKFTNIDLSPYNLSQEQLDLFKKEFL